MNAKIFKTDEEKFWAGHFGDNYIERNNSKNIIASNLAFFIKATNLIKNPEDAIEFGANIGMNIKALKLLFPKMKNYGIEINKLAVNSLKNEISEEKIYNCSVLEFCSNKKWDLVYTKGLLIHINPDELSNLYDKLVNACNRYLLVAEYYNPIPVTINYRGHDNQLYKRDFAGEIMSKYKNLQLRDYGFIYKGDQNFPQDDLTWFLLEKIK